MTPAQRYTVFYYFKYNHSRCKRRETYYISPKWNCSDQEACLAT